MKNSFWAILSIFLMTLYNSSAFAVAIGGNMPSCALSSIGGSENIDLSQYKGKIVYVDFGRLGADLAQNHSLF